MTEKQRTYQSDVHALQKISLQARPVKEKANSQLADIPLEEENHSSPPAAAFSRELVLRLINRLKGS